MENRRRSVVVDRVGQLSGEGVLVISHPIQDEGAFAGYITLSLPIASIKALPAPTLEEAPRDLVIFNADGQVLTSNLGPVETDALLPVNRSLSALVGEKPAVFVDQGQQGTELRYAVAPILPGVVYSMSIWNDAAVTSGLAQAGRLSILLPGLMWLASLVVAFWSINRLAIRHIRKLADQVVNTSAMNVHELRQVFLNVVAGRRQASELVITFLSFGFQHGVPTEADLMFDVRFLKNPHWVPALRPQTGQDRAVAAYMRRQPVTSAFLKRLVTLLRFLVPRYIEEGKAYFDGGGRLYGRP
ncbi:MAG: hypothetical protein HC814_08600, partial [Rhodobacteraceae bacterium]|nr:hypothetical protein [Paracoccaceae bacterium]